MRPNDSEQFEVQWLKAKPGAVDLGIPTIFGTSRQDSLPFYSGLGEIPKQYRSGVTLSIPDWMKGAHHCGTDHQWRAGWPVGTPSPIVGPDRIPLCCQAPPAAAYAGGLLLDGGAALVSMVQLGRGGLLLGGASVVDFTIPFAGRGGLLLGGSASVMVGPNIAGRGGLLLGGLGQVLQVLPFAGRGGLLLGGLGQVFQLRELLGKGGLLVGGSSAGGFTVASAGGLLLGGSSEWDWRVESSGGLLLGGSSTGGAPPFGPCSNIAGPTPAYCVVSFAGFTSPYAGLNGMTIRIPQSSFACRYDLSFSDGTNTYTMSMLFNSGGFKTQGHIVSGASNADWGSTTAWNGSATSVPLTGAFMMGVPSAITLAPY